MPNPAASEQESPWQATLRRLARQDAPKKMHWTREEGIDTPSPALPAQPAQPNDDSACVQGLGISTAASGAAN